MLKANLKWGHTGGPGRELEFHDQKRALCFILLVISASLAGCSEETLWEKSPNVTGWAVAEKVARDISYRNVAGQLSSVYVIQVTKGDPTDLHRIYVSGKIDEDDIRRSIGKHVSIKCYRETPQDHCYASGFGYEGRELLAQRK
jgi:hypothetical protein